MIVAPAVRPCARGGHDCPSYLSRTGGGHACGPSRALVALLLCGERPITVIVFLLGGHVLDASEASPVAVLFTTRVHHRAHDERGDGREDLVLCHGGREGLVRVGHYAE